MKKEGTMTQYLDRTNAMPEYLPYPRFLLKLSLTPAAKLIYAMLLDRYTLSKKNNWQDEEGHIYLVYPIDKLAEDLEISASAVKRSFNELTEAGLIRRSRKGFSSPNRIYIMIPEDTALVGQKKSGYAAPIIAGCENNWKDWVGMHEAAIKVESDRMKDTEPTVIKVESDRMKDTEPTVIKVESDRMRDTAQTVIRVESDRMRDTEQTVIGSPDEPSYSPQTDLHTDTQPTPNQYTINNNTLNNLTQTSERAYGEFGNVMLTEAEYGELNDAYPDIFPAMLDFLSARIRDKAIPDEPHGAILRRMLE
ncbi:MAG: replication initiator protein A [Clostridia bacterium]|nr:replication initiator protein A [Clostridia bacterium]